MTNLPIEQLRQRIADKSAVIGVVGLGYVGLPLAQCFADAGFRVLGFDVDDAKVTKLNAGTSYIERITNDAIQTLLGQGFVATGDYSRIVEVDAVIICVPTPLGRGREPDLSYVIGTTDSIVPHLHAGQLVCLESTTYPGTTDEELRPRIEARGLVVGRDIFLVFSPEREDPSNPNFTTRTIPKVCGGTTPHCLEAGMALYGAVIERVVPVSSTRAAEMTKLLENIHRAVNIGLVNEMKIVADRMGIDIHEVIDAAATKPFGFVAYYPGPGLGGHCIPIDPFYLTWKAREYGVNTRFIELAGEVNSAMPEWVVHRIGDVLNDQGITLRGANILMLGLAYKKNVDDTRESPAVHIMHLLQDRGARVAYSDPHVSVFPNKRDYSFDLTSVALTPESLAEYDCCVLVTQHDRFDYELILEHAKLIVDTRGVYRKPHPKVRKA